MISDLLLQESLCFTVRLVEGAEDHRAGLQTPAATVHQVRCRYRRMYAMAALRIPSQTTKANGLPDAE